MKPLIALAFSILLAGQALAGGRLDAFKFTGTSTLEGFEDVAFVPIFWDARCANVNYVVDDVPANAGTPNEIPATALRRELQSALNQWNRIPTSYINMNIVAIKTLGNGIPNFDFVNELTFEALPGAPFLAASASRTLQEDAQFATGDDLDGDGDSDVFDPAAARRNSCFDVDDDGDIEFPAGTYKAGTILDNDVVFNPEVQWSTQPGGDELADIQAVAVHEFGHSHGLSHSVINQISANDGTAATMFPFLDTNDAGAELGQRSLHSDDIAWSSFIYQEGSASSGPAALQHGDRPFRSEFGLIKGEVLQRGVGVAGASVKAIARNGETLSEGFSGTARGFRNGFGEVLVVDPAIDPTAPILDGRYTIPVAKGTYDLMIEALDGAPASPGNISFTAQVGGFLGQNLFPEEFRSSRERAREPQPGMSAPVTVESGAITTRADFITNEEITLRNSDPAEFLGDGSFNELERLIFAERFTNAEVLEQLEAGAVATSAQFQTTVADASAVPKYQRAGLFVGRLNADGSANIDLRRPILARNNFIGQDIDLTPLFISPEQNQALCAKLKSDPTLDVFLVLETADELATGASERPAQLALSFGFSDRSFMASGGGPFMPTFFNWSIELHFSAAQQ